MSRNLAKRLLPGSDFREELESLIREQDIRAAVVVCAVGSLREAVLRMADASSGTFWPGPLEIVSCTGTLGFGGMHVHLSFSDRQGKTFGGHLLAGCIVHTTIELVVNDLSAEMSFDRQMDDNTACLELSVLPPDWGES